jgi:TrmH family RNA methyltransferase
MKSIASRDNPQFRQWRALAHSVRQQRAAGVALLEGPHLAAAWLDTARQPQACLVTAAACARDEVAALLARIDPGRVIELAPALFAQLSDVANGVQILLVAPLVAVPMPARIDRTCVVLDGIQDAGNVGSILRSAAAAGVAHVFCAPGTAAAWSQKVLRSAMGAHFLLGIHENVEVAALGERLDVPVLLTDSHGALPVDETDLRGAAVWVFGNEGAGVSAAWRARAACRVAIPQPGGMESLNVAAAAAICLFEQCRQQRVAARRPGQ